jgi:hypothetical protein
LNLLSNHRIDLSSVDRLGNQARRLGRISVFAIARFRKMRNPGNEQVQPLAKRYILLAQAIKLDPLGVNSGDKWRKSPIEMRFDGVDNLEAERLAIEH